MVVPVPVSEDWSLVPAGLDVGDTFRLLFATSFGRNGASGEIADYNDFVQTRAGQGHADIQAHSSGFRAVASTVATDARDNTGTTYTADDKGVPIHWLGGSKVVDDYEDFYDGSWDDETNAKDESGDDRSLSEPTAAPFTGSEHDGTVAGSGGSSYALGVPFGQVRVGMPGSELGGPIGSQAVASTTVIRPFYALSTVFEVVAAANLSTNSAPEFANDMESRSVAENSAADTDVGAAVTATDTDVGDTLSYSLEGTEASSFKIVTTSGQIQTQSGVMLDHETKSSYTVAVKVVDGNGGIDTVEVTITVTDVDEQPATPAARRRWRRRRTRPTAWT